MAIVMDSVGQMTSGITPLCFVPREVTVKEFDTNDCIKSTNHISPFNAYDVGFFSSTDDQSCCIQTPESFANCCEVPKTSSVTSPKVPGSPSCFFMQLALKRIYPKEDFEVLESLGEGFFGTVYKVRHKIDNEVMVLKMGKNRESRMRAKTGVLKEVTTLNQLLSHPNLIAFRGVCVDLSKGMWDLHILVDYCDGGSLNRLINDLSRPFSWKLRYMIARDISAAMKYVHSRDIMHRDLTSMNVLLQATSANTFKGVVADFGLSCRIPKKNEFLLQVGTPYWMAPECLKEEFYDEKADIFSFGIILCQMIARIEADPEAGLYRTNNFGLDYVRFANHCRNDTPLDIFQLAFQCCLLEPSNRPSFAKIYDRLECFFRTHSNDLNYTFLHSVVEDSKLARSMSDAAFFSAESDDCAFTPTTTDSLSEFDEREPQNGVSSVNNVIDDDMLSNCSAENRTTSINSDYMDRKSQIVELARSIAVEETTETHLTAKVNPFMNHQLYRSIRKITPMERKKYNHFPLEKRHVMDSSDGKKSSKMLLSENGTLEGNTNCDAENFDALRLRKSIFLGWNGRRSFSYPCALQSPRKIATSTLPRHANLKSFKSTPVKKKNEIASNKLPSITTGDTFVEGSSLCDDQACESFDCFHGNYGMGFITSQTYNNLRLARELNNSTPADLSEHLNENGGIKSDMDGCSKNDSTSEKVETIISSAVSTTRLPSLMCSVRRSCRRRKNAHKFETKAKLVQNKSAVNGCSIL